MGIAVILIIIAIAMFVPHFYKNYKSRSSNTTESEMIQIKPFNKNEYIKETIDILMYDIENSKPYWESETPWESWKDEVKYNEIILTKSKKGSNSFTKQNELILTIKYDFDDDIFKIKSFEIKDNVTYNRFEADVDKL
jgi:hypothetical protein